MKEATADTLIHPIIDRHLDNLGVASEEKMRFLSPSLHDLPSPFLMNDMEQAANLVIDAIERGSKIIIWGDYDVDGISGTALLALFFRHYGVEVTCHIPNRLKDGYGLNKKDITRLSGNSEEKKLLISVDCGISNQEEIQLAQSLGYQVVVTDHHQPPAAGVVADAVINPKLSSCDFPFDGLAGVGVAFYLAAAIRASLRNKKTHITVCKEPNMKFFMGLVALGTIADLVPLVGVNRILARAGLEACDIDPEAGLAVLLEELEINHRSMSGEMISFQIAPMINAAGRLGEPTTALKALITTDEEARQQSKRLVLLNRKRKKIGFDDFRVADQLCGGIDTEQCKAIVIKGDFHDGVLGITASRLVEKYHVPAFVCCVDAVDGAERFLKGSARAPVGIDLYRIISESARFLKKYGGHKSAAGFSLQRDHFEPFKRSVEALANLEYLNLVNNTSIIPSKLLELSVSEAFDPVLLRNISQLEPVGEGNPKPVFRDTVRFVSFNRFGKEKEHARGVIRGKYRNIPYIGFGVGRTVAEHSGDMFWQIQYSVMLDHYNGSNSWKIRIEDISPAVSGSFVLAEKRER